VFDVFHVPIAVDHSGLFLIAVKKRKSSFARVWGRTEQEFEEFHSHPVSIGAPMHATLSFIIEQVKLLFSKQEEIPSQ